MNEEMTQMIEQAEMIRILRGGGLINLGEVTPGAERRPAEELPILFRGLVAHGTRRSVQPLRNQPTATPKEKDGNCGNQGSGPMRQDEKT